MRMLNWLQQFSIFSLLDSHHYLQAYSTYGCLAAAGAYTTFKGEQGDCFDTLQEAAGCGDWVFGHIGYDCKNEVEPSLSSRLPDGVSFADLFFFQPEVVLQLGQDNIRIGLIGDNHEAIYQAILATTAGITQNTSPSVKTQSRFSRQEYVDTVVQLKKHIQRGDCYEINFCQEFYADDVMIEPASVFHALTQLSPNPFCGFYRVNDRYLLCASPERFLKKQGDKLVSQPIKGTVKRQPGSPETDAALVEQLRNSAKEKSENVMVVDLVRNDLSKVCEEGSVQTDELYGIYTFPQVHHMISTVTGTLKKGVEIAELMKALFPMGSMTGAPKKKVMELIERYERSRRGIFSGALGYIDPNGNFDFNVVIRSILYNAASRYLSYQVGSGITWYCDAESEYEECLLKARAIEDVLRR
jgi:para-aminobenzoate synthetase component I